MMQSIYERMRDRVENVVKRGSISNDYIPDQREIEAFSRWTDEFTPQNHPPVIQVCVLNGACHPIHAAKFYYIS